MNHTLEIWFIRQLLKVGKIEEAAVRTENLLQENPSKFSQLVKLANRFHRQDSPIGMRLSMALEEYIFGHASDSMKQQAGFYLGALHHRAGKYASSSGYLKIDDLEGDIRAISILMDIAYRNQDYPTLRKLMVEGKSLWEHNPDTVYCNAQLIKKERGRDAVKEVLLNYLESSKGLASAHYLLGDYFWYEEWDGIQANRKYLDAHEALFRGRNIEFYDQFQQTSNLLENIRWSIVNTYDFLGEKEKLELFKSRYFNQFQKQTFLMDSLFKSDQYDRLLGILLKELVENLDDFEIHYYKFATGKCYLYQKKYSQAEEQLKDSITLGEQIWRPFQEEYIHLTLCKQLQGKEDWVEYFEKALTFGEANAYDSLIEAKLGMYEIEGIWEDLALFSQLTDYPQDYLYYRASAYTLSKQYGKAIECYQELIELVPRSFSTLFKLADIYKEIGDQAGLEATRSRILAIEGLPENKVQQANAL